MWSDFQLNAEAQDTLWNIFKSCWRTWSSGLVMQLECCWHKRDKYIYLHIFSYNIHMHHIILLIKCVLKVNWSIDKYNSTCSTEISHLSNVWWTVKRSSSALKHQQPWKTALFSHISGTQLSVPVIYNWNVWYFLTHIPNHERVEICGLEHVIAVYHACFASWSRQNVK